MPTVTIDGRTLEVEAGTNLIEAASRVGIQIPHYCYHPRLSVVGQCRMCLVKIEGMPKLQAGCSTQVARDGMVVHVDDPEVREAQEGVMEFLLINHPLDCPICDQAGECGLQDYSFKHGQAFSRFNYEEKRIYPGRERIPLGPHVLLNMNRCIQCTRCIRFTEEVSGTAELGFFQRGARTEIGVFPGKQLDNPLSANVVDICPVGALTSTRFRFAERVWYLEKTPSLCTGCDAGCNVTLEHRRGAVRRYKPRFNPAVNDYWMCDFGRDSYRPFVDGPRLATPRQRTAGGDIRPLAWSAALETLAGALTGFGEPAVLAGGGVTTEEAYLLRRLAERLGTPHRGVAQEPGPERSVPNLDGGVTGSERTPNRRGAELAGLVPGPGGLGAAEILAGDGAVSALLVAGADRSAFAHDPEAVARLRRANFLAVLGWAESPLAQAADLALPAATHAETEGTFVNSQWRLQRFERAYPAPGLARPGVETLGELLARLDGGERRPPLGAAEVFARWAGEIDELAASDLDALPAVGLAVERRR